MDEYIWHIIIIIDKNKESNISNLLSSNFLIAFAQHADTSGPVFIQEPPNQVDFSNTTGMEVICQSRGTPLPRITWVRQDGHKWVVAEDVPGLRQVWNVNFGYYKISWLT